MVRWSVLATSALLSLPMAALADPPLPYWGQWQNSLKPTGAPGPEITLARQGRTDYVIVIPAQPTPQEQKAAEELAQWLAEMTGGAFAVVGDDRPAQPQELSVGRTNRFAAAALPGKAADLGEEGYGLGVAGQRVYLWGGTKRGPLYAVFALLEEDLGCRWYHRTGGNRIPHRQTLILRPVPRTYKPVFRLRDPFYFDAFEATWSLRNRTNAPNAPVPEELGGHIDYDGMFVHTFNQMVPPDQYFAEHPEYYALVSGQRTRQQLCLTNPEVLRMATEFVLAQARANPNSEILEVSPNDGGQHCECPNCKALDDANGGPIGSYLTFVNAIAAVVEKERPDLLIGALAYLDTTDAPRVVRPRDNVIIRLCDWLPGWSSSYEDWTTSDVGGCPRYRKALDEWSRIAKHLTVWDYINTFGDYLAPLPMMHVLSPAVNSYRKHGLEGVMYQADYQGLGGADSELRAWVIAKLLWDPDRDVAALMADFLRGYYAEAAPEMIAYHELVDRTRRAGKPFFEDDEAFDLFAAAERAALSDEVRLRVQVAKLPLLKVKLDRAVGTRKLGSRELVLGTRFSQPPDAQRDARYSAWIDEFEGICARGGITNWSEQSWDTSIAGLIGHWRELLTTVMPAVSALDLGDRWRFRPDPQEVGMAEGWAAPALDDSGWTEIGLQDGWTGQGFAGLTGYGWYRKEFTVPGGFPTQPAPMLLFGAADEDAEVWLNGEKLGDHTCASTGLAPEQIWTTPFALDPGPLLHRPGPNLLAVRVYNRLGMGGLWQPVYLLSGDREAGLQWLLVAARAAA